MYADAAEIEKDDARESVVKWARQSESAHALRAMMTLAHSDRKVSIRDADLDSDPWTLNVANGTVDLRTGELRPHDSAEMHSKVAGAGYVAGVDAPRWQAFLERVLPDAEVREFVHKLAGYSVAGEVGENVLPFPYGPGANGKSVFLGVLREVLGDYATEAAPDLLVARRERGIPVDVADLRGYRFVTTTEVEGGRQMASDVMKRITGEPRLKARKMRQDFESFVNVTKLWMAANDRPRVDGLDEAIWRRIRLIPFDVTIPPVERDPDLMRKLLEERDGILTWAIEGCLAYGRDGLIPPPAVMAATDEYRSDSNPLLEWVDADCELDATASTGRAALRESYERYCKRTYAKPVPARSSKWAAALEELGCRIEREGGARVWGGIKLTDRNTTGLEV
jgi:putative DNA primase/helicase